MLVGLGNGEGLLVGVSVRRGVGVIAGSATTLAIAELSETTSNTASGVRVARTDATRACTVASISGDVDAGDVEQPNTTSINTITIAQCRIIASPMAG